MSKKYHVVSLKHTNKKDNYVTLWRPDNKGYCYMVEAAGVYGEADLIPGYHDGDDNVPIEIGSLDKWLIRDGDGRLCYGLTASLISLLKSL
jgi:hypothetical protein